MTLRFLPTCLLLCSCGDKGDSASDPTAASKIEQKSANFSRGTTTATRPAPVRLEDADLIQKWTDIRNGDNNEEIHAASLTLFRRILKESPDQLGLLVKATNPGSFREAMLLEIGSQAELGSILVLAAQVGDELDVREWLQLGVALRVEARTPGRNRETFLKLRESGMRPELKRFVDTALGSTIQSIEELPLAEKLTHDATEVGVSVAEAAFREIGRKSPNELWAASSSYSPVAKREARKAALLGMARKSYQSSVEFAMSQSSGDPSIQPLSVWAVDRWLRSDPLQASAWVDKNGNKEMFIAVAEFSSGRGDSEAAKLWRARAR